MNSETLSPPIPAKSPNTHPPCSNSFRDAKELQRLLMADARNPELKPAVRAALARSFCELEECKRKLKMRPLPRSIDTTKLPPKGQGKAKAQGFTEA